eukprot:TRINITY_DN11486_c0_g2_i3.p1 TRINITY_DN11486_c0_g2~~TRINITY_DN11486_c0_g2_i3.p1  ORF type:complete len:404 (+),score=40.42 TRINITY_DN11486_c0_g2_i3:113-1324(+)
MSEATKKMRLHAFECPVSPRQAVGWIVMFGSAGVYYGLCIPFLPFSYQYPLAFVYAAIFVLGFILWLLLSLSQPGHPALKLHPGDDELLAQISHNPEHQARSCVSCKISTCKNTKHCKLCHKCIINFDHHCVWLNTCIGGRNYRVFLALIFTLFSLLVFQLSVTLFILSNMNDEQFIAQARASLLNSSLAHLIFLVGMSVAPLLTALALAALLSFNVLLLYRNQTTYQYLMEQRTREDQEAEKEEQERLKSKQPQLEAQKEEIYRQWKQEQERAKAKRKGGAGGGGTGGGVSSTPAVSTPQPQKDLEVKMEMGYEERFSMAQGPSGPFVPASAIIELSAVSPHVEHASDSDAHEAHPIARDRSHSLPEVSPGGKSAHPSTEQGQGFPRRFSALLGMSDEKDVE